METTERGVRKFRWLAWNPLWLLIAAAWVALVVWAMRARMAEQEQQRRAAEIQDTRAR